jgi:hypothetical protein
MSDFIDLRLEPGLWLLGEWSLRWAILIAALALWFAIRTPRQAALRLAACQLVLVAGLALPLIPHWWGSSLLPAPRMTTTEEMATESSIAEFPEPTFPRPIAKPTKATAISPSRPIVGADSNILDVPAMQPSSSAPERTAEPLGARRIALLFAASLWSVGTCVQLIRLIAATLWLSHLRRGAVRPHLRSQELLDRCRQEIGLRRAVRLGTHSALTAPLFVGGWRCTILVPTNWEQLPIDAQRAVLWHELAHVARRDDWAKLAEETIRAVFFFHPLVYWLLNRIDGYREQVCDAAAVRRGVTGRMLAQILVDFSRQNSARRHRDLVMRPALPFFRRRTVRNRIYELLEDKTVARWSDPLMQYQLVGLALIAASTGVALGGLGPQAVDPLVQTAGDAAPKSPASGARTSAPEKSAASPNTAGGPTTLERVLASWNSRAERTKSVYCSWESRMTFGQKADDRIAGKTSIKPARGDFRRNQFNFWSQMPDRFRLDSVPLPLSQPWLAVKTKSVIDGTTDSRLEEPGDAAGAPVCSIETSRLKWPLSFLAPLQSRLNASGLDALDLAIRPQDAFVRGRPLSEFRVTSENAIIDGVHCVELQHAKDDSAWVQNCWVDPARDYVVVAYAFHFRGKRPGRGWVGQNNMFEISIQYQRHQLNGWVPASWTYKGSGQLIEDTVSKFTINEKFPEETFVVKLSPGTVVFDQRSLEQYRVAKDGSKSDAEKFDSPMVLGLHKVLETKIDFRIEPQSLKDAIDFIAARYQIPILLNQKDCDAAGIDITSEVQFTRGGVAVADLLKDILGQMSKPVGFRIENEVLQLSPKFAGQAPIQAQAVGAPDKIDSPMARQIQTALAQPVDFTIEPQSLKDALDWIAARYQIPIARDPSIDMTTEVKGSFPGIRLRNLLILLLEQYPTPLGFKIEDKALKIFPKPGMPQPPAAKRVSNSDKSKMNAAIQKVLQAKIDETVGPASLRDALDEISKRHKIPIVLDEKALLKASTQRPSAKRIFAVWD